MSYDKVLDALEDEESINYKSLYHTLQVDEDNLDEAKEIIEEQGAEVTNTNLHEAGATIYFVV